MTTIIVALLAFLSTYLFLYVAFSRFLVSTDSMELRLKAVENITNQRRTDSEMVLSGSFGQRILVPLAEKFTVFKALTPEGIKQEIDKKLLMAGGMAGLSAEQFIALSSFSAVILMGISLLISFLWNLGILKMVSAIFYALFVGLFFPYFILVRKISIRQESFQRDLPDVLDLITVSVEAGLSFDGALGKLSEKMKGALVDEFSRTLQEMRMGVTKRDALKTMSNRCGNKDLSLFISALVQADQLGVSIGKVLKVQADGIRVHRGQQIEKKATKAPIMMLFPLVVCIFPSLFIVLLGPAVIQVMEMLSKQ